MSIFTPPPLEDPYGAYASSDEAWLGILSARDGLPLPDSAAALVLGLDVQAMSQAGRLAAIAVGERSLAALTAVQAALIAEVARVERAEVAGDSMGPVEDPERESVAMALGVSPRAAATRIDRALGLCHRLPEVWSALRVGRILPASAWALVEETAALEESLAQEVASQVLPLAMSATPGVVRRRAAAVAAHVDPATSAERHERAMTERRVVVQSEGDGMASLWWLADAATITQARHLIDTTARASGSPHLGGIDAARSDALASLLLDAASQGDAAGPRHRRRRPVVAVHVNVSTLLGGDEDPGDVPGLGPIPASVARTIAADADWQAFLHSADGRVSAVATKAYTPTDAMVALVIARDGTCRFPGCAAPAHRCDVDHRVPFDHRAPESGGPTHPDNLQALCRRHHQLKTNGAWRVHRDDEGTLHWVGPHGERVTVDDPDPP